MTRRSYRGIAATVMAALAVPSAGAATTAEAHHSIFIREVRASIGDPAQAFVELQTYRQGQNDLSNVVLQSYDPSGLIHHDFTIDGRVPNDQSQHTILIGGAALAGTADFVDPALGTALSPAAGAVCFPEASPPDCVSWGSFADSSHLPFPGAGPPAPAIPEGSSLTRSISPGCPLGLDQYDDSNNSANDFSITPPTPQPNSAAPTDRDCVKCGGAVATQIGSDRKETLMGTSARDVIVGNAGADKIKALKGNDIVCGGIGKDVLVGGAGRDQLFGGRGRDRCKGGAGRDKTRTCEVLPP